MPSLQDRYDDASYAFTRGDLEKAIRAFRSLLEEDPGFFDAQLSLGLALCRKGDYAGAIEEGHKAEKLKPRDQLVHTNLSLFYLKAGDKLKAEHHALQARIASWREPAMGQTAANRTDEIRMTASPGLSPKAPTEFPDMPWKKSKK